MSNVTTYKAKTKRIARVKLEYIIPHAEPWIDHKEWTPNDYEWNRSPKGYGVITCSTGDWYARTMERIREHPHAIRVSNVNTGEVLYSQHWNDATLRDELTNSGRTE